MKQSIDHALNSLKGHSHSDSHTYTSADTKKQSSSGEHVSPLGEYTFYPSSKSDLADELSLKRPSLPHIYDDVPTPHSNPRRRRSAGQDAELEPPCAPSVPCKLGSKYFHLNLFRRAAETPNAGRSMLGSPYLPSSSASTPSASPSPAPRTIPLPTSPRSNLSLLSPSSPPES